MTLTPGHSGLVTPPTTSVVAPPAAKVAASSSSSLERAREAYGRDYIYYEESEMVELPSYLVAANGDILFNGVACCGLNEIGGEIPLCTAENVTAKLLEGSPLALGAGATAR